jgi:hypothetical protein
VNEPKRDQQRNHDRGHVEHSFPARLIEHGWGDLVEAGGLKGKGRSDPSRSHRMPRTFGQANGFTMVPQRIPARFLHDSVTGR